MEIKFGSHSIAIENVGQLSKLVVKKLPVMSPLVRTVFSEQDFEKEISDYIMQKQKNFEETLKEPEANKFTLEWDGALFPVYETSTETVLLGIFDTPAEAFAELKKIVLAYWHDEKVYEVN